MKGNDDIIELLNEVLTGELTSINQYFVDAKMAANWGYERLAKHFREESIDEMKDADELIERILYLDGHAQPAAARHRARRRDGRREVAARARARTRGDRPAQRRHPACVEAGDNGSRELLENILEGEEKHADWLETQLELIDQVGEAHYLAEQIHD